MGFAPGSAHGAGGTAAHLAHTGKIQQLVELARHVAKAKLEAQATGVERQAAEVIDRRHIGSHQAAHVNVDTPSGAQLALLTVQTEREPKIDRRGRPMRNARWPRRMCEPAIQERFP